MRAPAFWWDDAQGPLASLLKPFGAVYGAVTARRMAGAGLDVGRPVICIGNFIAGGAGKTPVAIAVAELLRGDAETPFFLSRGYGGAHRGAPRRVDAATDSSAEVGDEPLLLARIAPTIVSADRRAGALACVRAGASAIVLDDGLQSPALHKTRRIAVVDGAAGVGNGLCVPAGPLRAPLESQWSHVDALIVIGDGRPGAKLASEARTRGLPVFEARLRADAAASARLTGQRVYAFAGIGRPEKFIATLNGLGAIVAGQHAFADHHRFTRGELDAIRRDAAALHAVPVTTEKDLVRIDQRDGIEVVPVRLEFAEPDAVREFLRVSRKPRAA